MQPDPSFTTKRPRHVRAHANLDSRLTKSQRADGSWVYEIRRDVFDAKSGKTRRVYETCGTRIDQAKQRLAEVTRAEGKGERLASLTTTFFDLIEGWRATRDVAPRSREREESVLTLHLLPRWGGNRVQDIRKNDWIAWRNGLQLSDGSKRVVEAVMRGILDFAVDEDALAVNPLRQLSRRDRLSTSSLSTRIVGEGELEALLRACESLPWMRPIIQIALFGALRLGEIVGLRWQDVDFENGKLHIRQQLGKNGQFGPPKGGQAASIELLPSLRKLLAELHLAAGRPEAGPVFPNSLSEHRHPRSVQLAWRKIRDRSKISNEPRALRFHDLRHTAASRLANAPGARMPQVQQYLRHSDLATTFGYVHHIPGEAWAEQADETLQALSARK